MKKRLLTLFMLATLATTALVGCGTKEEKTEVTIQKMVCAIRDFLPRTKNYIRRVY